MSNPRLRTKDSLKVILCLTLSSVTLTVQSPNSNAANWGWSKGRPSVTTDLNWSYASRHTPHLKRARPGLELGQPDVILLRSMPRLLRTLPKGLQ